MTYITTCTILHINIHYLMLSNKIILYINITNIPLYYIHIVYFIMQFSIQVYHYIIYIINTTIDTITSMVLLSITLDQVY